MDEQILQEAPDATVSTEDRQIVSRVRAELRAQSRALREAHPWLSTHQSAIGLSLLLLSLVVMIGSGVLYYVGVMPALLCVVLVAMATSIAHELEHDNIHNSYFRDHKWVQNLMLLTGWAMRPSTINPWVRRTIHLDHHRISGTEGDIEERGITNGERWGFKRILMLSDNFVAVVIHSAEHGVRGWFKQTALAAAAFFPFAFAYSAILLTFLGAHGYVWAAAMFGVDPTLPTWVASVLPTVNLLAVVWVLPEMLRSFSLKFISSNAHYYGNIASGDILRQTQVLNHPVFWPFQLFCFNFGSTHAIHHFWVPEPFYIRQWTARSAHETMRRAGVPFNDLGTFARANRYDWQNGASAA